MTIPPDEDTLYAPAEDDPDYWERLAQYDDTPTNGANGHGKPKSITELEAELQPPREDGREPTVVSWAEYRIRTQREINWIVKGLLPSSGFNIIGSTPKAGKTWFLSLLAICCATGTTFLGRFVVVQPVRVHFLALEGSEPALRHRIGCLARGLGIDPDGDLLGENLFIDYKPAGVNLSEAPYAAWYCDEVERIDARLCLVDTVRRAARIRESGEGVGDLQRLTENLAPIRDRSVLFAHHARKMAPANQGGNWTPPLERLSGSGDWGGIVEMGLVLDRRKGTEWRDTRMEIDGRDIPGFLPMRVVYEGDGTGPEGMLTYDDSLTVRIEEDDTDDEDAGKLNAEEVSAWLSEQPRAEAKARAIATRFGVDKRTVQRAHPSFKKWGIAWDDPPAGGTRHYWLASPAYAHLRREDT